MTTTVDRTLTVKEASAIIKACQIAGVQEIVFRGLRLSFGETRPQWGKRKLSRGAKRREVEAEAIDQESLEKEEFATKDQQVAELVITDPAQYEQLIEQEELVDGEDDGEPAQ
jgi:hypothetical protein